MNLLMALLGLFSAWFLVLTIPGPNFIAVSQYSIAVSRRTGLQIALGVSAGAATWATVSLVGISAIFEYVPWLFNGIKVIGGLYLSYFGLKIIISSFNPLRISDTVEKYRKGNSAFRLGLFTSYANPKTAAFFGSLFVMSFPPDAPNWFYLVTVVMIFCASLAWYSVVAYFFSITRVQAIYNRYSKIMDKITGLILLYLGARLAFSRS